MSASTAVRSRLREVSIYALQVLALATAATLVAYRAFGPELWLLGFWLSLVGGGVAWKCMRVRTGIVPALQGLWLTLVTMMDISNMVSTAMDFII